MAVVSPSTLSCCFCGDRRWDTPEGSRIEIRLTLPLGQMKQWFGCHEDCLAAAFRFGGFRTCAVCGRSAGRTDDLRVAVLANTPAQDRETWAHFACLQAALASGYTVELDMEEPLAERDADS